MIKTLLWAKSNPHKSLLAHMIDVGVCVQVYLEAPSSEELLTFFAQQWHCSKRRAIQTAAYLCAVHDEGKAHPAFQGQDTNEKLRWTDAGMEGMLKGRMPDGFRHEYYSTQILKEIWKRDLVAEPKAGKIYCAVIKQHHQKRKGERPDSIQGKEKAEFWRNEQEQAEREIRNIFLGEEKLPLPVPAHMDACCTMLLGVMILCDWVASSKPFEGLKEDENYVSSARKVAERAFLAYGLVEETPFPAIDSFAKMWPQIQGLRPLQKASLALDDKAWLTIIEAPMGEGKTETALYLAGRICNARGKRGIYVALPTQATSNSMYERVDDMLRCIGLEKARLMHGTAFLMEDDSQHMALPSMPDAAQWLRPLRLALLESNAVGTVDQVMASVLRIRFSVLRLLGLQNKVLVIDEIHAYDSYMGKILEVLLKWCYALRIPVILLSATMRSEQKKAYLACYDAMTDEEEDAAYPLITQLHDAGRVSKTAFPAYTASQYRFRTCAVLEDSQRIARMAISRVDEGGCVCVLMNTVRQAQDVYTEIQRMRQADCQILLFHARFTVERRAEIEKRCLTWFGKADPSQRPRKAILVATAVVEQSLDLDFDAMLTQIAPMDLLLQRAGRVHRHHERQRPERLKEPVIDVLVPDPERQTQALDERYGLSGYVYDPYLLSNTEKLIGPERTVRVPEDIRSVIEAAYHGITEENMAAFMKRQTLAAFQEAEAMSCCISEPDPGSFYLDEAINEWDITEIDDGFEPRMRPSTRLGEPSVRVVFCSEEISRRALLGELTREEEKMVFLKSVALPMPRLDRKADIAPREIQTGILKGCVVAQSETSLCIGPYTLTYDSERGVFMNHHSQENEEV